MKILGIDPGYERLGIAILEGTRNTHTLLHSECFKTSPKLPFEERLALCVGRVEELLVTHTPDLVVLEKLFFGKNQKTALRIAEIRGALIYIAQSRGAVVAEYTPLQVKSAVTGYGGSTKRDVAAMLHKLLSIEKKKMLDDEYDAVAVAVAGMVSAKAL